MICLFKLTSQFRALYDGLCAANSDTNATSSTFDTVLHADSQAEIFMNETIDGAMTMANLGLLSSELLQSQKRALVIASWHQRLIIHRSFFCRSFQHKKYHYSRFVSLAAARNILRCYLAVPSGTTTDIWTVPAHAISACFIITLNSVFSAEKTTLERSDMELMYQCVSSLEALQRPSAIVERGLRIIQNLLDQSPRPRFRKLDPDEISELAREIGEIPRPSQSHETPDEPEHNSAQVATNIRLDFLDQPNNSWDEDDFCMAYLNDPIFRLNPNF